MFLTAHDQRPFFGGTYYPPRSQWGRPGFVDVLTEINRAWRDDRLNVVKSAAEIVARLELGEVYAKAAVDVPDTQRFRAGGDESVRGYAYRSLTPQIDGVDVGGRPFSAAKASIR